MTELRPIICPQCNGTMVHENGNIWKCQYCGSTSLFDTNTVNTYTNQCTSNNCQNDITFNLTASIKKKIIGKYSFKEEAIIKTEYRPRATKADKYPMNLKIVIDGKEQMVAESIADVGFGTLTLTPHFTALNIDNNGKIVFSINKKQYISGTISKNDVLIIGDISLKIE